MILKYEISYTYIKVVEVQVNLLNAKVATQKATIESQIIYTIEWAR
jgi:hypothetical protein